MNKAIYIVEDDENIREMIRMALTSFSYEVTAFDNAEDALTAKGTELDKVTGLDCGADDYIAKPFGVMELGARIRALFRRAEKSEIPPSQSLVIVDLTINGQTREVSRDKKIIDLTFKEYELLWILIRERGRIVPREELLNAVWGFNFLGESRTLDIHIRTLRQKLGDDADDPKYIKTVRNVGYRFIGE